MNLLSNIRKGIASLSLFGLAVFGFGVSAAELSYTDAENISSWAVEAIQELGAINVMNGNDDGSFAPERVLNRAEVSKVIVLAADVAMDTTGGPHFPDVEEGAWYYDYVETMYNYGWINGYPDGAFRPGNEINRAEIAKMVVNAFELKAIDNGPSFSDVNPSDWFYSYVETVKGHAVMAGYADGTFDPSGLVNREETAVIVYNSLLSVVSKTEKQAGTLELALSNNTPRGTNIPYNATSVPYTTVELTASDDNEVQISSITVTRLGLGDNDDFENVWLEIDGFKVGNSRSINNDDVAVLRFNPPIVVPAGQTLTADIVGSSKYSLNSDGTCYGGGAEGCNIGHHNRLAIVSADDVESTASNVVGNFPIEGEEMEVADYQVSQLVFSELGSDTTVNVGDTFVELGKFRMLNSSTTNKDIELRALTLKNLGTAELKNVLENTALYVSGEQVSAETIMDGDYLTFRLDNGVTGGYVIEDGDSRIFSIRADVVSAEANDKIQFKVDNFEDIVAIEIGTAFGVKTVDSDGENAEDANATLKTYSIDSGDINVSRDPNSLGNQEYAPGSNDVVALTARVVVSQPMVLDGVKVVVDSYDTGATDSLVKLNEYFDNFRLYLNDSLIDSENELSGTDTAPYLNYNTQFEITGASVLKLVMNIKDEAKTGSFVKFALYGTDFDSPEYISSGDTVQEEDLLGSAMASKVEVQVSELTVVRTDGFANETVVAGVTDATFMKFVMDNNDSGDVNVTSLTIKGIGEGVAAQNYSNFTLSLWVDGQQIGSSRTLSSDGTASFNDIAVTIPSAGQEEFTVTVDTIEAVATESLANTTVTGGPAVVSGVTFGTAGAATDGSGTISGTIPAGATIFYVAGDVTGSLSVGDSIVISADGLPTGGNAELKKVSALALSGADTMVTVTSEFINEHNGQIAGTVVTQYIAGTTSFTVASANNISVGDVIVVNGTDECQVTAVSGSTVTVDKCDTTLDGAANGPANTGLSAATPAGSTVSEPQGGSKLTLALVAADVDNAENGSEVVVYEGGDVVALGSGNVDAAAQDGDCQGAHANNYLCGAQFGFTKSGTLTLNDTTLNSDKVLVANTNGVEVYKLELKASDDEVQVKDLYLINTNTDFDARADFHLYNQAGQLLATKQMTGGKLHFELNSNKIIVPAEGYTVVTVKADIRSITSGSQTGKTLSLNVDTAEGTNGVVALTGATGANIEASAVTNNSTLPQEYVAYRTALSFANASSQPSWNGAAVANEPIFNFTVTSDAAYPAVLNKLAFQVSSVDATLATAAGSLELVRHSSSSFNDSNPVVVTTDATTSGTFENFAENIDGTSYYQVRTIGGYTDAGASDFSEIKVSFQADTSISVAATYAGVTGNTIWSDRSASTGYFMNGYELDMPIGNAAGVEQ